MEARVREVYSTREGIIVSPGKFEGEMIYVPHLWDQSCDNPACLSINDYDRMLFPELGDKTVVYLYENGDGFVSEIDEQTHDALLSYQGEDDGTRDEGRPDATHD